MIADIYFKPEGIFCVHSSDSSLKDPLAIFLIAFFSIFILAKYNLDYLSEVYYWTVVLSLSFLFLCIGLMSGYFLGFGLLNIRDKNRGFLTYLDFLFKEYDSLESSILRFFFYGAIFIGLVAEPIVKHILLGF